MEADPVNHLLLTTLLAAFAISSLLVWAIRILAFRFGLYDAPGPLKIHTAPVPRLGGVGLIGAFVAGVVVCGTGLGARFSGPTYPLLAAALALVWATGLVDDLRGLTPALRLAIQVFAGLLIYRAGLSPLGNMPPIVEASATCTTVVVFTNAFNFLDGSDGLAAGSSAISAAGFIALFGKHDPVWAGVAASLAASCVGLLAFNFPTARIFMGDSGSTVLGLLFAMISMRFVSVAPGHAGFGIALLVVGLPLIDFSLVVARRLLSGKSPLQGDRSHFYDRLLQRGWTPQRVAYFTYVLTFVCLIAGLAASESIFRLKA